MQKPTSVLFLRTWPSEHPDNAGDPVGTTSTEGKHQFGFRKMEVGWGVVCPLLPCVDRGETMRMPFPSVSHCGRPLALQQSAARWHGTHVEGGFLRADSLCHGGRVHGGGGAGRVASLVVVVVRKAEAGHSVAPVVSLAHSLPVSATAPKSTKRRQTLKYI